MNKIISIIGSSSLLASYLIEEFLYDESVELNLFSRKPVSYAGAKAKVNHYPFNYPTALLDFDILLASDVVVYCAAAGVQASSVIDVNEVYEINLFLPIRIINYLHSASFTGKWFSFGTYFEIGDNSEDRRYTEVEVVTSLLNVPNHYCASKRLLSRFIDCNQFVMHAWHLILPTIYGAKENSQRLIPYIVDSLKKAELPALSAGAQIRQYVHCRDIVALLKTMVVEVPASGIYNVAEAETLKISDLVSLVFSFFKEDPSKSLGMRNSRDESMKDLKLDATKLAREVHTWRPIISLAEGVQEYISPS